MIASSTFRGSLSIGVLFLTVLSACSLDPRVPRGFDPDPDGSVDSGSRADAGDSGVADSGPSRPRNLLAPTVTISTPTDGAEVPATVTITGTANDDSGLASVFVEVGPNAPRLATSTDGFRTWTLDSPTPLGSFAITAYAYDSDGKKTLVPASILVSRPTSASNTASPVVTITSPASGTTPRDLPVLVRGTASDDVAVVRMEVLRNGELLGERPIVTEDFFASWIRLVPLLPGTANVIVFRAYDEAGHVGTATITLNALAEEDRTPPALMVTSPADSAVVSSATLTVTGSASDQLGVRLVKVRVGQVFSGTGELVYEDWVLATTTDGFASFTADVAIPSGAFTLEVKAIDVSGLATTETLTLSNSYVPSWSDEQRYPLFLRPQGNSEVRLELDEAGVNAILNPSIQMSLKLLELDPSALVSNALTQIKNACGTAWQQNNSNPNHNCDLTPLGVTFGGPGTNDWQNSPEYALVRLLTMTPANVVVDGTSIAGLKDVADGLNVGGGFREILSDMLGIALTTEIVSTANASSAIESGVIATHPNIGPSGGFEVNLYDVMNDLAPLGTRFGPSGSHPGILDPAFTPNSVIFGPNFLMTIVANSNLRWLDGLDLNVGKDYIATVVDTTGPTYSDVLEFDFTTPSRFSIDGLVSSPVVDLRMKIFENNAFIPACTTKNATAAQCKSNLPATPFGTSFVWSKPGWELEAIVGRAAYNQYRTRTFSKDYYVFIIPAAHIDIGNPAGWTMIRTTFGLGNPPPDQYLWELINEVGQVALHRLPGGVTISEGNADVAFTLLDIPVGITDTQIRAAVGPSLQAQASTLSNMLLGNYWENNGPVDFFYRLDSASVPTVFFIAPSDRQGSQGYSYAKPGFFSDAALTNRVSALNIAGSGDTTHQKLRLPVGETTVYSQDETGAVYRLRFVVGSDPSEIACFVSRKTP